MKKCKNRMFLLLSGAACGFLNGFFGAGGGTLAVPLLRKAGLDENESHAGSVAVILAAGVVSAVFYLVRGSVTLTDSLGFIYGGVAGAALGAFFLKRIPQRLLRGVFGALIIAASIRMLIK